MNKVNSLDLNFAISIRSN